MEKDEKDIIDVTHTVAEQGRLLSSMLVKLEKHEGQLDTLRLDMRELIIQLKIANASFGEIIASNKLQHDSVIRLETTDAQQQKAIEALQTKAWAMVATVLGGVIAQGWSLISKR